MFLYRQGEKGEEREGNFENGWCNNAEFLFALVVIFFLSSLISRLGKFIGFEIPLGVTRLHYAFVRINCCTLYCERDTNAIDGLERRREGQGCSRFRSGIIVVIIEK